MNSRREILLREMGLGPLWTLRRPAVKETQIESVRVGPVETQSAPLPGPSSELGAGFDRPGPSGVEAGLPGSVPSPVAALDWAALKTAVAECRACGLCQARKQAVLGVGDVNADWLFVGEGPGAEEDERGEPFVGQAGRLLDAMLAAIGLKRGNDVYIGNAVKCRPPDNRTPEAGEMAACRPYLQRQIALIRPKLIVALGRPAAQTLLQADVKIGAARGQLHAYQDIPVIVTYHPAYLLRNLADKAKAWEDLVFMKRTMARLKAASGA